MRRHLLVFPRARGELSSFTIFRDDKTLSTFRFSTFYVFRHRPRVDATKKLLLPRASRSAGFRRLGAPSWPNIFTRRGQSGPLCLETQPRCRRFRRFIVVRLINAHLRPASEDGEKEGRRGRRGEEERFKSRLQIPFHRVHVRAARYSSLSSSMEIARGSWLRLSLARSSRAS